MVAVAEILKEELERLWEAEKSYRREIGSLSKGSIQRKRIRGKEYPYLVFRSSRKVVSRYLGQRSEKEIEKLEKEIELRRKQQQMLRQVRKNIADIQRMLRGRKSA